MFWRDKKIVWRDQKIAWGVCTAGWVIIAYLTNLSPALYMALGCAALTIVSAIFAAEETDGD